MHRTVLVLGLAILFLPVAAAHAIPADLIIEPFLQPLPFSDIAEPIQTSLRFDYQCGGLSRNATEPGMTVRFEAVSAPAGIDLRIEPAEIALPECEGLGSVNATLHGSATRDATPLSPSPARIRARWHTSGAELDTFSELEVTVPWVSKLIIQAEMTESTSRPQTPIVFPITLTNGGNGLTRVTFEVVSKTPNLMVPVPNPVTLQAADQPQHIAKVPIVVQTPYHNGRVDEDGTVTFRISTFSPLDPTAKGEPEDITFTVRTQGWYVPGPQAFGAVVAVGVAALLSTRRRA